MLPLKRKPISRLQKNEHTAAFDNSGTHRSVANWCNVKDEKADFVVFLPDFIATSSYLALPSVASFPWQPIDLAMS